MVCAAVPPPDASSVWLFEAKLFGGCALLVGSAALIFRKNRR
jgi:hypothetical protein